MRLPNIIAPLLPIALSAFFAAGCVTPTEERAAGGPTPVKSADSVDSPAQAAQTPAARPKFDDGERAFEKAKKTLMDSYYSDAVGEEELYRAALEGMLEHLDPAMKSWQKLLTPAELAELHASLQGEVVGIGAEIKFDPESGYTDILGVLPRSGAEHAGLGAGDKIVTIDGKLFKGMTQADVIASIRGKAGVPVALSILRGDKLINVSVTREKIALVPVEHFMVKDQVGYVMIRVFSEKTSPAVKQALEALAQKGARNLVLDLRDNQGGMFDEAVATAGLFLQKGTKVVVTKKRGGKEETAVSKGDPILGSAPLEVLVNGKTSSGAELLAGALQEGRSATIIGERTFGKWSVQMISELGNGYAMKYTIGIFATPAGHTFEGEGMPPDIEVDMDDKLTAKALLVTDPAKRLAMDGQLRTAVGLFEGR